METDQFCHRGRDAHGPATQLDRRIEKEAARALFGTSVWFALEILRVGQGSLGRARRRACRHRGAQNLKSEGKCVLHAS